MSFAPWDQKSASASDISKLRDALTATSFINLRDASFDPPQGQGGAAAVHASGLARHMTGASGLFGFVLNGWGENDAKALVDGLDLFGIGASWGGFESLAILAKVGHVRTAVPWRAEGPLVRLHIGLEDPADLIADLDRSFAAVAAIRAGRSEAAPAA